jgi:CubicO group peptidase (beta-lactamase class C family)
MKRLALALTTAIVVALGTSTRAADNLVLSRFSDYLEALRVQAGIPGLAATIVATNDTLWERGYGLQDVDRNIATRSDTPFPVDGLMQTIVASLALRCDETPWLSIDDPVSKYVKNAPEPNATLRMLMTHTSQGAGGGLEFLYRMDRLAPLAPIIAECDDGSFQPAADGTFRSTVAKFLRRMAMLETIPGTDVVDLDPGDEGFDQATLDRYKDLMTRRPVQYALDSKGRASPAPSASSPTLAPSGGLLTSVRDLAKFDLALKSGVLMSASEVVDAWTAPKNAAGLPLPHGIGWFVQTYNGEPIVWQFGESATSSSMMITAPRRGLTLILLANSPGLARGLNLGAGDMTVSPFARVFLGLFVR